MRKLSLIIATAAVAISGFAPVAAQAKATSPGKHSVTKTVYVYTQAGKNFTGTMFKKNTFKVERLSPSGRWAYGMAYGHVNRHAWIDASALTVKK